MRIRVRIRVDIAGLEERHPVLSRDRSDLIDAEEGNVRATTEVVYGSQVAERGPGLPQPAVHTEMPDEAAADPV